MEMESKNRQKITPNFRFINKTFFGNKNRNMEKVQDKLNIKFRQKIFNLAIFAFNAHELYKYTRLHINNTIFFLLN